MKAIKPIRSEIDYENALERSWVLLQKEPDPDSSQGHELEILITLIEKYEQENYAIPEPDPINYIRYVMEQKGMNQEDLTAIIGHKSRVSEILNRKRRLTLEMIRELSEQLDIPVEILIKEYPLVKHSPPEVKKRGSKHGKSLRAKKKTIS